MSYQIEDISPGQQVRLRGWVYRQRASKDVAFVVLRDASDRLQCVFKKDSVSEDVFEKAASLPIESAVIIEGNVREDERAPTGLELDASSLEIIHEAERFPITRDKSEDFLLDVRHLWLRSQKLTSMMKIKHTFFRAAREFLMNQHFYEVQPPLITASACEGGSTLFSLDYFGDEAYLSQSGQLYAEALIYALERVFCFAPSFRAEKSRTKRHLMEYWHLEPEMTWYSHEDNIQLQIALLQYVCNQIATYNQKELKFFGRDPHTLYNVQFDRMTYDDAVKQLQEQGFNVSSGVDFGSNEEYSLTAESPRFLIVERYPLEIKAFYMKTDPQYPHIALCNDVLAPEGYGEIIGGSERETDNRLLIQRLQEEGQDLDDYEWYLDLRKYGSVPHSGFGMGVERVIRWICDLDHIRDATPFPRTLTRYYP